MTVYLVIIEDRHVDVEVLVYTNRERAIEFAQQEARERNARPENFEEEGVEGWEYSVTWSSEGDCLRVERAEVIE
jgi:hypothetical protein